MVEGTTGGTSTGGLFGSMGGGSSAWDRGQRAISKTRTVFIGFPFGGRRLPLIIGAGNYFPENQKKADSGLDLEPMVDYNEGVGRK